MNSLAAKALPRYKPLGSSQHTKVFARHLALATRHSVPIGLRRAALCTILAVVSGLTSASLKAQVADASLSGTITGPAGKPVVNARISIRNVATGRTTSAQAGAEGTYYVSGLAPGDYEISVMALGFDIKTGKLTLTSGSAQVFNATLAASISPGPTEPSLSDLGFSPSQTQGTPQYQAMLDRRSHMLQIHQRLGLIAAAPMIASLFTSTGAKGHHGMPGPASGRELHAALGASTAALYFSSAYFAIRAPKIPGTRTHGPIRVHKALAWIHGPGMILTPILGAIAYNQLSNGQRVHGIAKYHSDVAAVTAAAYGAAIISVSVKF